MSLAKAIRSSIVIGFMCLGVTLSAQYTEVGLGLGQTVYWGDLNAPDFSTNIGNAQLAGQVYLRYNHTPQLAFRAGLMVGKIKGDDRLSPIDWQQRRNLRFESTIVELSAMAEYYLFGVDYNAAEVFSPYVTAGLAMFRHNPKTDYLGQTVELQPLGTEGQGIPGYDSPYSLVSLSVPFGAGAKIAVSEKLSFNIAILGRRTFTDYLDDVSGSYVTYDELRAGNGEISAALANRMAEALGQSEPVIQPTGSQRGGETVRDYYFSFMISANYYLGTTNIFSKAGRVSTTNCPTF